MAYSRRLLNGCGTVEHLGCSIVCASSSASSACTRADEVMGVKNLIMRSRVKTQHAHTIYKDPVARIINRSITDMHSFLVLDPNMAVAAKIGSEAFIVEICSPLSGICSNDVTAGPSSLINRPAHCRRVPIASAPHAKRLGNADGEESAGATAIKHLVDAVSVHLLAFFVGSPLL